MSNQELIDREIAGDVEDDDYGGGPNTPVVMVEVELFSPGGKPIATIPGEKILGHDPKEHAVIELLDAKTGRRKLWIGFPYAMTVEPAPPPSSLIVPAEARSGRRIIGG